MVRLGLGLAFPYFLPLVRLFHIPKPLSSNHYSALFSFLVPPASSHSHLLLPFPFSISCLCGSVTRAVASFFSSSLHLLGNSRGPEAGPFPSSFYTYITSIIPTTAPRARRARGRGAEAQRKPTMRPSGRSTPSRIPPRRPSTDLPLSAHSQNLTSSRSLFFSRSPQHVPFAQSAVPLPPQVLIFPPSVIHPAQSPNGSPQQHVSSSTVPFSQSHYPPDQSRIQPMIAVIVHPLPVDLTSVGLKPTVIHPVHLSRSLSRRRVFFLN